MWVAVSTRNDMASPTCGASLFDAARVTHHHKATCSVGCLAYWERLSCSPSGLVAEKKRPRHAQRGRRARLRRPTRILLVRAAVVRKTTMRRPMAVRLRRVHRLLRAQLNRNGSRPKSRRGATHVAAQYRLRSPARTTQRRAAERSMCGRRRTTIRTPRIQFR